MRWLGLLVAVTAFGLGFWLGQGTVATPRALSERDAPEEVARAGAQELARPTPTSGGRVPVTALEHEDTTPPHPQNRPRGEFENEPSADLLDALRRALENGQVAEYEALWPGWLKRTLSNLYLGVGDLTQALALIDGADADSRLVRELADKLLESGDRASAAQLYRPLLEADPWDSTAYHGLRRSDPAGLVSVLERGLAEHPDDERLASRLGWALRAAGRTDDALALARGLLDDDPEEDRGWGLFVDLAPEEAEAWTRERAEADRAWAPYLAGLLEERGAIPEAIEVLSACLAEGYQRDAVGMLTDLDPGTAASYLAEWSRQDPSDRELRIGLAEALESAERTAESIETWAGLLHANSEAAPDSKAARELLRLDPDRLFQEVRPGVEAAGDADRWERLARWYESAERMDAAREALDRALELEPWQGTWRERRARLK